MSLTMRLLCQSYTRMWLALLRESPCRRWRPLPTIRYVLPIILYVLSTILYVGLDGAQRITVRRLKD